MISLGIDGSRNRSGGAKAHLIGLIEEAEPERHGFSTIHVWSHRDLLDRLPSRPWLVRHNPLALERSIFSQLTWQRWSLSNELARNNCSILLNTDAGSVSRFLPSVTMSRDMLSYEPGEAARYGFGKARLRLLLLKYMQNESLRHSSGAIFLTQYAATVIQQSCGPLTNTRNIPHGVSETFRIGAERLRVWRDGEPVHCIYVSNAAPYKHQTYVLRAVDKLRKAGFSIRLTFVGGGTGRAQNELEQQMSLIDPDGVFSSQLPFVSNPELPALLADAHVFIFASSCENMPNTLLEGMAAGLPIACSNRGPMPEVLQDGGVYFDPQSEESIAASVSLLINNPELRNRVSVRARELAGRYSWRRCAEETLAFLAETYKLQPQ